MRHAVTEEVAQAELIRRVLNLVDRVGVQRLTFRKHSDVGPFLRNWAWRASCWDQAAAGNFWYFCREINAPRRKIF